MAEMRLSEAIRRGVAMDGHQVTGWYFRDGGCCAMGAAMLGAGLIDPPLDPAATVIVGLAESELGELCGLLSVRLLDPRDDAPQLEPQWVVDLVITLNDAGWTRERIADWLETEGH